MSTTPAEPPAPPPKPVPPRDEDCCGNDCTLCVFTCYERELERWQDAIAALAPAETSARAV